MRFLKYVMLSMLVVSLTSCGDPDLPFDLEGTMSNTGGYVRIISVESAVLDFANAANAEFAFIGEVGDESLGSLSESVTFYAKYVDFERNELPEVAIPAATVAVSSLTVNQDSGLPRGNFRVTLNQILDAYGASLNLGDLNLGDRFDVRWQLNMKDGRAFSAEDVNASLTGGFYRSPFFRRVDVVASLPETMFVGNYTITQSRQSNSVSGGFFTGWLWNASPVNVITLAVDPENPLVGRTFQARPYAEWGPNNAPIRTYPLQFAFFTTISAEVPVVGSCSGQPMSFAGALESTNRGSFDPFDDSTFTFFIRENPNGGCFPPDEIMFTAVKN